MKTTLNAIRAQAMSDDEKLAERLARAEIGENHWQKHSNWFRGYVTQDWLERIGTIRRAGLALVEAEEGR